MNLYNEFVRSGSVKTRNHEEYNRLVGYLIKVGIEYQVFQREGYYYVYRTKKFYG